MVRQHWGARDAAAAGPAKEAGARTVASAVALLEAIKVLVRGCLFGVGSSLGRGPSNRRDRDAAGARVLLAALRARTGGSSVAACTTSTREQAPQPRAAPPLTLCRCTTVHPSSSCARSAACLCASSSASHAAIHSSSSRCSTAFPGLAALCASTQPAGTRRASSHCAPPSPASPSLQPPLAHPSTPAPPAARRAPPPAPGPWRRGAARAPAPRLPRIAPPPTPGWRAAPRAPPPQTVRTGRAGHPRPALRAAQPRRARGRRGARCQRRRGHGA